MPTYKPYSISCSQRNPFPFCVSQQNEPKKTLSHERVIKAPTWDRAGMNRQVIVKSWATIQNHTFVCSLVAEYQASVFFGFYKRNNQLYLLECRDTFQDLHLRSAARTSWQAFNHPASLKLLWTSMVRTLAR